MPNPTDKWSFFVSYARATNAGRGERFVDWLFEEHRAFAGQPKLPHVGRLGIR